MFKKLSKTIAKVFSTVPIDLLPFANCSHIDIARYFRDQIITPSTFNMNGLGVEESEMRERAFGNHLEILIKMTIKDKAEEF